MAAALELTLGQLSALANKKASDLERLSFRQPLEVSKLLIVRASQLNFSRSSDPEGTPWLPLKRPRRRTKGRDLPLRDTGLLLASVVGGARHVERITDAELLFGTNLEYAGFHQFGTRFIPKREFLGFNQQLIGDIDRAFGDYVEKQLGF